VRQLLLFGAKREATLDLWEVQRYGAESYGDTDHVSVYGMRPAEWYARGIRLLGRTAVECTRDVLADAIAMDVAALAGSAPSASGTLVIDPFVGSGNTRCTGSCAAYRVPGFEPVSLAALESRCDWSALHRYDLSQAGQNHGVLLGTRGWAPP
jgi:hypothetical protein